MTNYHLITLLVNKQKMDTTVLSSGIVSRCQSVLHIKARGVMSRESWYDRVLPVMNPEQDMLKLVVSAKNSDRVMDDIVQGFGLDRYGSGSIYRATCIDYFNHRPKKEKILRKKVSKFKYDSGLVSIACIVQRGKADAIVKEIVKLGAVPSITYGLGRGVRDRLGLIRIAINPEKEFISVVVNDIEAFSVFETMVDVGRLHVAGEGFVYMTPIEKGIFNMASVAKTKKQSASMQEIVKAIDALKGDTSWRSSDLFADQGALGQQSNRTYLTGLLRLTCVVNRVAGDGLIYAALVAGAPGASVFYGRSLEDSTWRDDSNGIKLANEKEIIEFVLDADEVPKILDAIQDSVTKNGIKDLFCYTHHVPKAFTYLG
jgi:nitrogen regulatory protein P-II 1